MGFFDKFKKKKEDQGNNASEKSVQNDQPSNTGTPGEKRAKRYTSDGKPIYD